MKRFPWFPIILILLSVLVFSCAQPLGLPTDDVERAVGEVWLSPGFTSVRNDTAFHLSLNLESGDQEVGQFWFRIDYDHDRLSPDTSFGNAESPPGVLCSLSPVVWPEENNGFVDNGDGTTSWFLFGYANSNGLGTFSGEEFLCVGFISGPGTDGVTTADLTVKHLGTAGSARIGETAWVNEDVDSPWTWGDADIRLY